MTQRDEHPIPTTLRSAARSLGLGCASHGNLYRPVPEEVAWESLDEAWRLGIRYFDTAPHYGLGLSERRLGSYLSTRPRDDFRVSTKVGRLLETNPRFDGTTSDIDNGFAVPDSLVRRFDPSADGIRRSLDESLDRLGLDRVDIVYLHDPDVYDLERGLNEGLPALQRLRDQQMIDEIGVGVNDASAAVSAIERGDIDVVMIAGRYTLLEQESCAELLELAQRRNVRIVAAAVFNSGLLARATPKRDATYDYATVSPAVLARAERLARICQRHGTTLPAAALQFPLRHPAVSTVVFGSANADAIRQNVERSAEEIPEALWAELTAADLLPPPTTATASPSTGSRKHLT